MSDDVVLPPWLRRTFLALEQLPNANAKIVFAMFLSMCTMAFLFGAGIGQVSLDHAMIYAWLTFVGAWASLATVTYGIKRFSYKPAPPDSQDIEDSKQQEDAT